ncbi:MAG: DUF3040 domain-containing protein [Actinomycetaceae bacterium]|nr:DUF3040 domain-containing protein [Arcanobacterium sp.]MDD7504831.1 DUF3040 domain-containing protein [Actinomycetaceae bacterium]MDY6142777.1 DUF3040 domain-containing protein [Arcanobacterium sp.]
MALSEYEQKLLEELEAQLNDKDPKFAEAVASQVPGGQRPSLGISPKNLVWGILIALLGLGIALVAVSFELVSVGVLGVIVVFLGFWYMTRGTRRTTVTRQRRASVKPPRSGDFMSRQEELWQRRKGDGGRV